MFAYLGGNKPGSDMDKLVKNLVENIRVIAESV